MKIELGTRTEETVAIYFEKANCEEIRSVLPQKAKTVEEAIEDYRKTLLPDAASHGRIILADGKYVGDIWCYCINKSDTPNAMISYCIFEKELWNRGVATNALKLFIEEITEKLGLKSLGAFTYSANIPSVKVLEKNGFTLEEEFTEDGVESKYFQYMVSC